jgi:hypothetical protein
MNSELLWVFIPTIAAISLTPGHVYDTGLHAGPFTGATGARYG